MKKIFFLFMFLPVLLHAQNCITKKDPFTGKTTKTTSVPIVGSLLSMGPTVTLGKIDSSFILQYTFKVDLAPSSFTPEKMYVALKFADGSIKKYFANKDCKIVQALGSTMVCFITDLPKADLPVLNTNAVAIIRISYDGGDTVVFDQAVNDKKAKKIMAAMACLSD